MTSVAKQISFNDVKKVMLEVLSGANSDLHPGGVFVIGLFQMLGKEY